ncbi:uncharacterized protein LOC124808828 isoform X1 [Hydra vulgaris]|uniref:uncharacterized protein LOC124808828 isoform X1 n=1 Tax=Hydra vulgaris TaxID=6087 RepID=UPI001F5F5226|nr:uncharacterized protein LOC124808828 [Hydra vulgaris]
MKVFQIYCIIFFYFFSRPASFSTQEDIFKDNQEFKLLDQHYRNSLRASDLFSTPYKRITRLFHGLMKNSNHRHVSMNNNTVKAISNDKTLEAHLVIESDSFGRIRIHSFKTPVHYLCIGDDGRPVGIIKSDLDSGKQDINKCIFQEIFKDKYVQFRSLYFYKTSTNTGCLGFNRYGTARRVTRSKCSHKSTFFIERFSRIIIDVNKNKHLKKQLLNFLKQTNKQHKYI